MKRIGMFLSTLALVIICILLLPTEAQAAEVTASGTYGSNVTWSLDSEGTLIISGTGAMKDYTSSTYVPWYSNRDSVSSVIIEDGVTSIGGYAFSDCYRLTSVTIGNGVTSIGDRAFNECYRLTSMTIPDSVTSIGDRAFLGCTSLTSVTIPDSVTSIGYSAFCGCTSLTGVYITDIAAWCKIDLGDSYANPLQYAKNLYLNGELVTALVIPDGVTSIGEDAFSDCSSLTSITIPDSVTSIGRSAFHSCTRLTSVTIGNGVTSIGNYAFYKCTSLTSVTMHAGMDAIGESAFDECKYLRTVNFVGTQDDWDWIVIKGRNDPLLNAALVFVEEPETGAIMIGNQAFDTLDAALSAAASGDTVLLAEDIVYNGNILLPGGVTVDLNGHSLTVNSIVATTGEYVIDSSEGNTGLLISAEEPILATDNPQLPLYDSAKGGYRFFDCSVQGLGVREGTNDDAKFWFYLDFANIDACTLIARGDSQVKLNTTLTVGEKTFNLTFKASTLQQYANLVLNAQDPTNANYGKTAGMFLNITSISAAKGKEITLKPTTDSVCVEMSVVNPETLTLKQELSWEQDADFWIPSKEEDLAA